ncbi:MAG: carboxymuconolactone decarboxylase family protein [Desulfovibrio sp.]|jgi:alkylhydroperoxidase/carboxymuconolactone decarboxylase family protein YurZ|nr:carboxymuconolactone decarboxylase family protein [Desulfovibrio sp.]
MEDNMHKKQISLCPVFFFAALSLINIGEVQAVNKTLNTKQQAVVSIAAFTANGDLEKLRPALNEGLDAGLTVNETKEILVQMYAYCGFPRSLNGISTFMAVMDERGKKGIQDKMGKETTPMPPGLDRDRYGTQTRAKLGGLASISQPSGYQLFVPVIDAFLKEHLFADIFYRDNLDWQTRELATISALAAMGGVAGQLQFHMGAAMNMGITEWQAKEFIALLAAKLGQKEAEIAADVLDKVIAARNK